MTTANMNSKSTEMKAGPVFVVGMWRSGTSLLYALLNLHPQIALMYEGDLPMLPGLFKNGKPKEDWVERWEFWNGALSRHQVDMDSVPRNVANMREAMEAVHSKHAGLALWGCKSPSYYDSMVRLAKEFPGARFIVIYRDPNDIVRSVVRAGKKSRWFAKKGLPLRIILGYREMKRQAEELARMGAHLHELQYENLVRDPSKELMSICQFLGIAYDARMVSLEQADRSAIYNAEHHSGVKSRKIAAAGERKEVLSPAMLRKIGRYVNMWQAEYGRVWPEYPAPDRSHRDTPGLVERTIDRARYRMLRTYDDAIASFYCWAPLGMLKAYRRMRQPAAPKAQSTEQKKEANKGLQSVGAD